VVKPSNRPPGREPLSAEERASISANLFSAANSILDEQPQFPWHRDRDGRVTAAWPQSSQALAVDVFWTIRNLRLRDRILDALCRQLDLPYSGPWNLALEWPVDRGLLGEPRSSQIDVVATSTSGALVVECKFTEQDGGSCSQTKAIRGDGLHKGLVQCNGNYAPQTNPVTSASSKCALTAKAIRYWEIVPSVLNIDADSEHRPCPFRGGWYQWMRNLVVADTLRREFNRPAAFVVAYADGPFAMAKKVSDSADWKAFITATIGRTVPVRTARYQDILNLACAVAAPEDAETCLNLRDWVKGKIAKVSASRHPHRDASG
jgi:hypothetical protein